MKLLVGRDGKTPIIHYQRRHKLKGARTIAVGQTGACGNLTALNTDKLTLVSEDPGGKLTDCNPGKVTRITVGPGEDNDLTECGGNATPRGDGLDRLYLPEREPRKGHGETTETSSQGEEATEQGDLESPAP